MSIYATGDCHGTFRRFGRKYFPEQANMSRDDLVIICGDFGGLWESSEEENYWLDWLNDKPWTTLWVDGNHENFTLLSEFPLEMWHGGMVHRIRPNILHLMRGQVFELQGYTFFTMGGAKSHDVEDGILDPKAPDFETRRMMLHIMGRRRYRVLGQSWWPEELPSKNEYTRARQNLDKHDWAVDYIITHCAPTDLALAINRHNKADSLTDFLQEIQEKARYHYWLFGHYHGNQAIDNKHIVLWEQIVQVI